MAIAIDLLAKGDVDARKRSVLLLVVTIDPVELIAFDFIRGRCLDGVIVESNQVEVLLPIALVGGLGLSLRRPILWLLLLGRRPSLALTLRRIAVVLLRRWRRGIAAIVGIRIVAVVIGIVSVITIIGVAAKSKIEAGAGEVTASIIITAASIIAAPEAATDTASTNGATPGESAAAASRSAGAATTTTMPSTPLAISRDN